jgi:hypothetical protein
MGHPQHIDFPVIAHGEAGVTDDGHATFPRARYVLHQADWVAAKELEAFIMQFGASPYVERALAPF